MNYKPYLFLTILLLILFFILGVRYGQNVEKANKAIDFIFSLTPSVNPTQTPNPTSTVVLEYKSKRWGLKFKYPANLEIKESTTSAEILIEEKKATESSNN